MRAPAARDALGLAFTAAVALVACGGDDDESTGTTVPATTATPPTTAASDTTVPAPLPADFTTPEGDYSVEFPGTPTLSVQETVLPDGTSVPTEIYLHEGVDGSGWATSKIQFAEGQGVDLEAARDGAVALLGATLTDSTPIELQGRDGIEFTATTASQTVVGRAYADGDVSYQVLVAKTGEASAADPDIAAFFESFSFSG